MQISDDPVVNRAFEAIKDEYLPCDIRKKRSAHTPRSTVNFLINWAIARIKTEPEKVTEWCEVTIAIMILSGRKPAEILSTGVFEALDHTNIKFYGSLKMQKSKVETIYKIQCIGDTANEIVRAIQWLERMGKRTVPTSRSFKDKQDAAKKCHNRCSRYLSELSYKLMPDLTVRIYQIYNIHWREVK